MSCPVCGEYYFNEETDSHFCKELDIMVCDDCLNKIEENHEVTGKYIVDKCKCCGHVKNVTWQSYKKRGRKAGTKNKETLEKIDKDEKAQKHLSKWTGDPKTLEEFVHG